MKSISVSPFRILVRLPFYVLVKIAGTVQSRGNSSAFCFKIVVKLRSRWNSMLGRLDDSLGLVVNNSYHSFHSSARISRRAVRTISYPVRWEGTSSYWRSPFGFNLCVMTWRGGSAVSVYLSSTDEKKKSGRQLNSRPQKKRSPPLIFWARKTCKRDRIPHESSGFRMLRLDLSMKPYLLHFEMKWKLLCFGISLLGVPLRGSVVGLCSFQEGNWIISRHNSTFYSRDSESIWLHWSLSHLWVSING